MHILSPISHLPSPAPSPPPQAELDFEVGHTRPWLTVDEIACALGVSPDHVTQLFDSAALDYVVDIRAPGAARPYYRILRDAWLRYRAGRDNPTTDDALNPHLAALPSAMGSAHVAKFFRVSENHVLHLTQYFLDAAKPGSSQLYFRASKSQIKKFIQNRKL